MTRNIRKYYKCSNDQGILLTVEVPITNTADNIFMPPQWSGGVYPPSYVRVFVHPSEEANRSGSGLFVIEYPNLYQQPGSSNMIGWQLEVGVSS